MKRKKRKNALPRVTVFAMNARELAAFVLAVENLSRHVDDLRLLVNELCAASRGKKLRSVTKSPPPPAPDNNHPSLPGMGGAP